MQMIHCPNCGRKIEGASCSWCGISTPTESTRDDAPAKEKQKADSKLIIAGYACGFVALFFLPPAFSLAALVIGIVTLTRGKVGHGVALIVLAVTCGLAGMYMGFYQGFYHPGKFLSMFGYGSLAPDAPNSGAEVTPPQNRRPAVVYSVNEALSIAGFSKWTGTRYVRYILGDDLSQFKPLPRGASLRVLGDIQFRMFGALMKPKVSSQHPVITLVYVTSENIQQVECHIDKSQVDWFMAHSKNAWRALVHGKFLGVVPWGHPGTPVDPSKLNSGTPFNTVVFQPCYIDGMFDLHGDPTTEPKLTKKRQ